VINYLSYRYELFKAIESTERANLGTVFFPLSFALLLGLLWRPGTPGDAGPIAVGGLMAMTWGDALASIIGRRYGTRSYRFFGHSRTMEGTLAMFLASSVSIAATLYALAGRELHQSIAFAMIAATVAASVEAVSLYGSDNLTVPLATAGTLCLLTWAA
jgi:phytol kinase